MLDEVSDTRLQAMLKRHISTLSPETRTKLKGQLYCGSQVVHQSGALPAVFVVSNGEKSKLFGLRHCHSPWACPKCSAVVMAQKGRDIACAIDALLKWHNEAAFMVTFTLPHTKGMSAEETLAILEKTWHMFKKAGNTRGTKQYYTLRTDKNSNDRRARGTKGETRTYIKGNDPFGDFRETFKVKHFVRVYEFTWGENSWHPHIHVIFWTPRQNLQKVGEYEDRLNERWWTCAKRAATQIFDKNHPDDKESNRQRVNKLYADWKKSHKSVTFSHDRATGQIRQQKSSNYISGWSGDFEVAGGSIKTANNGHYSPHQLLTAAFETDDAKKRKKFLDLFVEYALATKGHRRVNFSARSGIIPIIRKWKTTESYTELLKKKFMDKATAQWKVVCWFSEQQWWSICWIESTTDQNIKPKILEFARLPDAKQLIENYIREFDIDISDNGTHHLEELVGRLYNESLIA